MSSVIEGKNSAAGMRIAIVVARFNSAITDRLLAGARDALRKAGAADDAVEIVQVPGSWELPMAAQVLAQQKRFEAIVALGAVIRGDTPHFDYVASQAAGGLLRVQLDAGIPVAFGVLTTNTEEQAMERAGGRHGNKGFDAAMTAIEMADLVRRLRK